MHEHNLNDALKSRHEDLAPPETHNRGTKPIDAILVSESCCNIIQAGWLEFKSNLGDHRVAYIDIKAPDIINKDAFEIVSRKARKLQIKHKKCVARYIKICKKQFRTHQILEKTILIIQLINKNKMYKAIKLLENVDSLRTKIVLKAEKNVEKDYLEK